MGVRACFVAVCLATLGLATSVSAEIPMPDAAATNDDLAKQHFQAGRVHHDNGEFVAAAEDFERAYALSGGRHVLLYNVFLAYRDANQLEKAAEALEAYLSRAQVIDKRAQLEARLANLKRGIAERKERMRKAAAAAAAKAEAEQQAESEPAAPEPVQQADEEQGGVPLGPVAVIAGGGALILGSVVTGLMARSARQEVEDSCTDGTSGCDPALKDTADRGTTLAVTTDVLLFAGIAAAGAGALWWLLGGDEDNTQPSVTAGLGCGHTGCMANVTGRY